MTNYESMKPGCGLSPVFLMLTVLFCICIVIANLVEIKTIDAGWLTITAGLIIFPVSYIINDCIVEVYGFAKARFVIWIGFVSSLFVAIMLQIAIWLPGGADWHYQDAMTQIYGQVPRIMVASFIAFFSGSMINAYVMSRLKRTMPRTGFSFRAIMSTLWGESVDSLIFFPVAFAGIMPVGTIISLIISQAIIKTLYEILILPVTFMIVRLLKRHENSDVTDMNISYKWWKINEI